MLLQSTGGAIWATAVPLAMHLLLPAPHLSALLRQMACWRPSRCSAVPSSAWHRPAELQPSPSQRAASSGA